MTHHLGRKATGVVGAVHGWGRITKLETVHTLVVNRYRKHTMYTLVCERCGHSQYGESTILWLARRFGASHDGYCPACAPMEKRTLVCPKCCDIPDRRHRPVCTTCGEPYGEDTTWEPSPVIEHDYSRGVIA